MPKMCTLFRLVQIKKRSYLICCEFWFVFLNGRFPTNITAYHSILCCLFNGVDAGHCTSLHCWMRVIHLHSSMGINTFYEIGGRGGLGGPKVQTCFCALSPFVCTARTQMCAHVKDPIPICRKWVGLTAGDIEKRKHCTQGKQKAG